MPPAAQKIFGPKAGAAIYGILYSAFAVAAIGGNIITKILTAALGWNGIFQLLAVTSAFAAAITLGLTPVGSLPSSTL